MSAALPTPLLEDAFSRVLPLRDYRPDDFVITRLPGYTNHSFRLQNIHQDWVLRIPKPDTDAFIDRGAEACNQAQAARLGLAPTTIWSDHSGLSLSAMLPGEGLRPCDLSKPKQRLAIVRALSRLHGSEHRFRDHVDLAALISRYYQLTPVAAQRGLRTRWQQAQQSLAWLDGRDLPQGPSHNDLILENLIWDDPQLWILDWEFSAMASPYWDLATLCNSAQLTASQATALMHDYDAGNRLMDASVLSVYRELIRLLGDCWMSALVPQS